MATVISYECNNCSWSGELDELVTKTDNPEDTYFGFCPRCGGSAFLETEEDNGEN